MGCWDVEWISVIQENISDLYTDIQKKGGILSEFPHRESRTTCRPIFRSGTVSSVDWQNGVLVIEAKEKSGSLITADLALEQGKDVYALPGPVDKPLSRGVSSADPAGSRNPDRRRKT